MDATSRTLDLPQPVREQAANTLAHNEITKATEEGSQMMMEVAGTAGHQMAQRLSDTADGVAQVTHTTAAAVTTTLAQTIQIQHPNAETGLLGTLPAVELALLGISLLLFTATAAYVINARIPRKH